MASFPMANPIDRASMSVDGSVPGGAGASNQYFSALPSMPAAGSSPTGGGNPGGFNISPTSGGVKSPSPFPTFNFGESSPSGSNPYQVPSSSSPSQYVGSPGPQNIPGSHVVQQQYPGLGNQFANWIQSQIGQGLTPFNLGTPLPTGGSTAPGQLTAGMNPLLQQLTQMLSGNNSSIPGGNTLNTIASQGVSALPEWQSMVAAMQDPIAQQTANLREQFGSMGNLAGSPFGTAMSNFGQQTALQQESLLGQLQQSNIQNIQMPAISAEANLASGTGQYLQGLDQQAIQNQYSEFLRTQPQYNPLISNMQGLTGQYPPTTSTPSGMGGLGALLGGSGQAATGLANLWPVLFP